MGIHHHDWPRAAASDHARALAELRALRQSIADRIEADIALLDQIDTDPDLEADYATVESDASGRLHFLGRSTDEEPSLCGRGAGDDYAPSSLGGDDREDDAGENTELENEHFDGAEHEDNVQPARLDTVVVFR